METTVTYELYLQNEEDKVFDQIRALLNASELEWELYEPLEDHFEAVASFGKVFKIKKKNRRTIWKLAKILLPAVSTIVVNSFSVYLNQEPMECINVNKIENTIIIVGEDR